MKRNYAEEDRELIAIAEEQGRQLLDQQRRVLALLDEAKAFATDHDLTPIPSLKGKALEDVGRPSKIRRQGSKIMSVLRSLTNSDPSTPPITPHGHPEQPSYFSPRKRHSISLLRGLIPETTVVHRHPPKAKPPIFSNDTVSTGPSTEPSSSTSGEASKSSPAYRAESTGLTSFNSKFSFSKTHHSSENKKVVSPKSPQVDIGQPANETLLPPIHEAPSQEAFEQPAPTIITVENAASAKIHLECHYNELLTKPYSPRSLRRRELEVRLYNDTTKTQAEKDENRRTWLRLETNHLRERRNMKARGLRALRGVDHVTSNYEAIKILGKGSFGVVRLVREKQDKSCTGNDDAKKQVYAMKVIRKSDMLRNSQEGHLRAERDFLVAAEGSKWVVPLIASFQDTNNLYLVMDYMPGGDFLGLLIRDNILDEKTTKWYIAEMILCIEEAHTLRWIHRDIKPDNFLISASGHLKISDFGLAFDGHWSHDQSYFNNHRYTLLEKLGITIEGDTIDRKEGRDTATALNVAKILNDGKEKHEKKSGFNEGESQEGLLNWRNRSGNRSLARSVVGTSQYMAPEVIRGERYDARCDWWSVAIILYECLYGHTPFLAEEGGRQQTKMNILNHKTTFAFPHKPMVGSRCKDLIQRMLQEKSERLCCSHYKLTPTTRFLGSSRHQDYAGRYVFARDAEDIKAHKWFREIDWDRIHLQPPPFIPDVKSMEDTRYFDEEEPISEVPSSTHEVEHGEEDIDKALRHFNREIQIIAKGFVANRYDSVRLRKIEKEIESFNLGDQEKEFLRGFVKHYGKREKKRPRDKMLRDKEIQGKVLELRKKGAFTGYTWRRMKRDGSIKGPSVGVTPVFAPRKKASRVWARGRLSLH